MRELQFFFEAGFLSIYMKILIRTPLLLEPPQNKSELYMKIMFLSVLSVLYPGVLKIPPALDGHEVKRAFRRCIPVALTK